MFASFRCFSSLRPYQETCIQASLDYLAKGVTRQIAVLPVGSGKTRIFASLVNRLPAISEASKVLVLAHREELIDQAAHTIATVNPGIRVEIEKGRQRASPAAQIIVASPQTLSQPTRMNPPFPSPGSFKALIIDEAHHSVCPSYTTIIDKLKDIPLIWGCSATPNRADGIGLESVFERVVYHKSLSELMDDGYIAGIRAYRVQTPLSLNNVPVSQSSDGERDYALSLLSKHVNIPERNRMIVEKWQSICKYANTPKSTLVFACDVQHVKDLCQAFSTKGIDARIVYGAMDLNERRYTIDAFRKGHFPVLINCELLTEGTDIPNIDCILLCRPTQSSPLLSQMVGRGLRKIPGKSECLIVDFVDNACGEIMVNSASLPSLFGLHPSFEAEDGIDLLSIANELQEMDDVRVWNARSIQHAKEILSKSSMDEIVDLHLGTEEVCTWQTQTKLVWTSIQDRFALSLRAFASHARFCLRRLESEMYVLIVFPRKNETIPISVPIPLPNAIQLADTLIRKTHDDLIPLITRDASWQQQPASRTQNSIVSRMGIVIDHTLTKGDAGTLISSARLGFPIQIWYGQDGIMKSEYPPLRWYICKSEPSFTHFPRELHFLNLNSEMQINFGQVEIQCNLLGQFDVLVRRKNVFQRERQIKSTWKKYNRTHCTKEVTNQLLLGPTDIQSCPSLAKAFNFAEKWIRTEFKTVFRNMRKDAAWRKEKASSSQLELLLKIGLISQNDIQTRRISRGMAYDLISKRSSKKKSAKKQ